MTQNLPARSSKIRQIPFDAQCVELVAETLGVEAQTAPFRLPSGAVYQIVVPDKDGKPATMLTIWPSIRRVDAISASSTVVSPMSRRSIWSRRSRCSFGARIGII